MRKKNTTVQFCPHLKNGVFRNFDGEKIEGVDGLGRGFCMFLLALRGRFFGCNMSKDLIEDGVSVEACDLYPRVTWLGHATFLVQIGDINVLTDPVFGNPSFFLGRTGFPKISVEELPKIDVVLISHNHRDHMDEPTLNALKHFHSPAIFVPIGDKSWFDRRGFGCVEEFDWWKSPSVLPDGDSIKGVKFTFLPAFHWARRGLFDGNRSLWGSWMIEHNGRRIYFAGDTAYGTHFSKIASKFPGIDAVLMPIGPHKPRKWMEMSHISGEDVCRAFCELGANRLIPMHWGTFYFGNDSPTEPLELLKHYWSTSYSNQLSGKILDPLRIGQSSVLL